LIAYTHEFTNHDGKSRYYLRVPGRKRVPLPGLPWSPEFMEARERALNAEWIQPALGASRTVAGTVNAGLVSYYQSTAFKDGLAASTQSSRRAILERFREEHGDKRVALMHRTALQTILNKKTAAAAKNWVKALRGWVDHCVSLDMIKIDPLIGLKLVRSNRSRIDHGSRAISRNTRNGTSAVRKRGSHSGCSYRRGRHAAM
jgi:hypothetical protein